MTAHPIDTEALRATAEATIEEHGPLAWPDIPSADLLALLDALAAAEHRATRAEAERDEWRQTALDERGAALDALEQIKVREGRAAEEKRLRMKATAAATKAEARIKAVQDVLAQHPYGGLDQEDALRRALESDPPPGQ